MLSTNDDFMEEARVPVALFNAWAEKFAPRAKADHICFKCGDSTEFERLRAMFENDSAYMYQAIISQRRIATIKFRQPLPSSLGPIGYLELSDQKPDGSQTSGFDHIEMYPIAGSVEELVEELTAKGVMLEKTVRPHHTTFDGVIDGGLIIRVEPEALVEKITREMMASHQPDFAFLER